MIRFAEHGANILAIIHTRGFSWAEIGESEITFTLETQGPEHLKGVRTALQQAGYPVAETLAEELAEKHPGLP